MACQGQGSACPFNELGEVIEQSDLEGLLSWAEIMVLPAQELAEAETDQATGGVQK